MRNYWEPVFERQGVGQFPQKTDQKVTELTEQSSESGRLVGKCEFSEASVLISIRLYTSSFSGSSRASGMLEIFLDLLPL